MPPFWNIISQILKLENKSSLSLQMSAIILRLLEIRDQTFKEAVGRNSYDYIDWDDESLMTGACLHSHTIQITQKRRS